MIERLVTGLAVVLASNLCISKLLADEPPKSNSNNTETVPEAIERAAAQSSLLAEGDFFKGRSIGGDAAFTFGIGYDENKLAKEARQLGAISRDLLNQQASQDPIVRTRDLPNPYSGSLLSDTELTDIQAEPSETGDKQPTRAIPDPEESTDESTDSEESTESESEGTEDSTDESNDSETESESESEGTEDSTDESNDSETESESENTEDTKTEP